MKKTNKKKSILGVVITDDPVEVHIATYLSDLIKQNKRLKDHVSKTGSWVEHKDIKTWKPFDFYNFFTSLYRNKYNKEFRDTGSIVRQYQRIEAFMKSNDISNEEYKKFIEEAFVRRFNSVNKPSIGAITSPTLYKFITRKAARKTTPEDLLKLDQKMAAIEEQSEDVWRESGVTSGMTVGEVLEKMNERRDH